MKDDDKSPPPDRLNEVGVLKRREIEARVVAPLLEALGAELGRERVMAVAREVIVKIAREQGNRLAEQAGGRSLKNLAGSLDAWTKDDALKLDVLEQTDESFAFDVTRCRFAELYHALGIPELGAALSCNRDGAMIEGFNPDIELTRTQTIMQGATHCDFRYRLHSLGKKPK
jgi:predicted ArsR family transcriptional regulator